MTHTAARRNFLISDSLEEYAQGLLASCETYYTLRQFERIADILELLDGLPLTQGQQERFLCYQGLVYKNRGLRQQAKSVLESIADRSGRALFFLGTLHLNTLDTHEARRYYKESIRRDPGLELEASHALAVVESYEGNHKGSLRQLESLVPLARAVAHDKPTVYLDHLNSSAVELCELGRIQEAGAISNIILASPYAIAYPEWRETAQEIAGRGCRSSRSFVTVLKNNVVLLPLPESSVVESPRPEPARLLDYTEYKKKMVKEPNGDNDEIPEDMSNKDVVIRIMNLTTQEGLSNKKLLKILESVNKILAEPED